MTRVLVVHNSYRQYGGEDAVFAAEVDLLRAGGYQVDTLAVSNDTINGPTAQVATAIFSAYNFSSRRKVGHALRSGRPDIVHVHNFFPILSPSIFDACAVARVPAVWTLHNFRIACANGFLFRDGVPCEKCLGSSPIHAVVHRCYRGSFAGSMAVASMIGYHQAVGTWRRKVARFIALTEFSRAKIEAAGVPSTRIAVKPNFVQDPSPSQFDGVRRCGALFVGRLSVEKGVRCLLEAWRDVPVPLTIIGDGPESEALRATAADNVRFLGHRSRQEVYSAMAAAEALIAPSLWYENFPMTVVEAMALGTPIIASRIGALAEIVIPNVNGLHFKPGDSQDLSRTIKATFQQPAYLESLQRGARNYYETALSPTRNLEILTDIYRDVIETSRAGYC